jgi:mannonate dehydratase
MEEAFRWYGPDDRVSLPYIRQTGATAIFTSLHGIPYGEAWPLEAILARKEIIERNGLCWTAVESVPVHEDIRTGKGDLDTLFCNYAQTLRHLAAAGVRVVVYNFMPVLDWVRTDLRHVLPDGSECLRFDPVHFAAFDVYALRRSGAEADYTSAQLRAAQAFWEGMDTGGREAFVSGVTDVFPGCKLGLTLDDLRAMLAKYDGIGRDLLKENYARFLRAVVPVAEEVGVRLAVHPDDPPFSILGLPRIVSTAQDVEDIFSMVNSPANGLCFCTGSFSVRPDNDLPAMVRRFGPRIHAVHLRSTRREEDGSFFEADHLGGSVDMYAVVRELLAEQDRRQSEGRPDCRLPFRPDHGHTMMDDLAKPTPDNPGYSCIGRMRGLAELRGLQVGVRRGLMERVGGPRSGG